MNLRILASVLAAVTLLTSAATAGSVDLVQNGDFSQTTFNSSHYWAPNTITGWSTPSTQSNTSFLYLDANSPGGLDATISQGSSGSFTIYNSATSAGHPGGSCCLAANANVVDVQALTTAAEASGKVLAGYNGNFIVADGDSTYNEPLQQSFTNLKVGHTYEVTFAQASGQQAGYGCLTSGGYSNTNCTNEQWAVSFCPTTSCGSGTQTQNSDLMINKIGGFTNWNEEQLSFVATSTSEVLSFLANGNPQGVPPVVMLANVQMFDTTGQAPEPSTLAIMGLGLLSLGFVRTRLKKHK
jgi:hypothetical protein